MACCNCRTVVRYKMLMRVSVSPDWTVYCSTQPEGAPHGTGVMVGFPGVAESWANVGGRVKVNVANSVTSWVGISLGQRVSRRLISSRVGVAVSIAMVGGGSVGVSVTGAGAAPSVNASVMPPITTSRESAASKNPPPICFRACMAYFSPLRLSPARAMGNSTLNVEPTPGSDSTQMRPCCASVSDLAMDSPTPVSPTPWMRTLSAR